MAEQIRTAVVGAGYFGRFHANHYSKNPDAKLVAVVDADADRAKAVADEFGAEAITDHRQILDRVDAVEKRLQFSILLDETEEQAAAVKPKAGKKIDKNSKNNKKTKQGKAVKKGRRREEVREKRSKTASKKTASKTDAEARPTSRRPAKSASSKKSDRRKKRFRKDDVPAFAKRVAQAPPRGHKKGKKKRS